jgi:hypothetical protein
MYLMTQSFKEHKWFWNSVLLLFPIPTFIDDLLLGSPAIFPVERTQPHNAHGGGGGGGAKGTSGLFEHLNITFCVKNLFPSPVVPRHRL